MADLAASFEAAVVEVLFRKTMEAARETGARSIIVAGGVSANKRLRAGVPGADGVSGSHSSPVAVHGQCRHDSGCRLPPLRPRAEIGSGN